MANMVRMALPALVAVACLTGCAGSRSGADVPETSTIVVENRHDSVISGWLQFGTLDSVAGGRLLPNARGGKVIGYAGPIPDTATIHLYVYPGSRTEFQGAPWIERDLTVPVKNVVPDGLRSAVYRFIVERDLSLRLEVLTHERYRALRTRGLVP